jgi:hypothetical protein
VPISRIFEKIASPKVETDETDENAENAENAKISSLTTTKN